MLAHLPLAIGHSTPYIIIATLFTVIILTQGQHVPTANTIDFYANSQNVIIEGIIADEPDRRPLQTKYTIEVDRLIDIPYMHNSITGKVLVTDRNPSQAFQYGDRVQAEGKLEKPKPIEDFRYDNYLSRYNIYAVMYRGSITSAPTPNPQPLTPFLRTKKTLYHLKESFEHRINLLFPEPHASFMAGLLTGSRRGIPKNLMENFNTTGLTHIIAISGYNITIVIAIISSMLFWLPRKLRFFPAVVAIICFTIFVGASAAVVRAAIMGILGLIALQLGRKSHARLSILWTGLLMVAWNPKILFYDAGFQLSFLAVIGLTELGPLLEKWCRHLSNTLAIRESVQMTIAAQLTAAPLIVVLFDRLSLIAPLANLLIAPLIPLAMLLGALSTIISYVSFPLGQLIAYFGWIALEWIIQVATIGSHIPFASIDMNMPSWILFAYYGFLIALLYVHIPSPSPLPVRQAGSPNGRGKNVHTESNTDTAKQS